MGFFKKWGRKALHGLGKVLKIAGPAAGGGAVAGPWGAAAALIAQLAAAINKKDGKKRKAKAGLGSTNLQKIGHHNVTSPTIALLTPATIIFIASQFGLDIPEEQAAQLVGIIVWASHHIGSEVEKKTK